MQSLVPDCYVDDGSSHKLVAVLNWLDKNNLKKYKRRLILIFPLYTTVYKIWLFGGKPQRDSVGDCWPDGQMVVSVVTDCLN